jgi:nucleotide-binding universal stress UspA family protein
MAKMPVVAAVDGSEDSLRAAGWAARAARRRGVPLRIVAATEASPRSYAVDLSPQTVTNALRGMAARALSAGLAAADEVAPGLRPETELLDGASSPPALTLASAIAPALASARSGAAMLVVGARGTGGFTAMALGSVSRYLATHATCPVVVVRDSVRAGSVSGGGEIVVGIGGPEDNDDALAFAFDEAAASDAELLAMHAWGIPVTGTHTRSDSTSARAVTRLSEALAPWRDKYVGVPVRYDVVHGHPAWVLASYSARAELVVLGRRPHMSVGSIQHAVLGHAHGPVAIVPSGT